MDEIIIIEVVDHNEVVTVEVNQTLEEISSDVLFAENVFVEVNPKSYTILVEPITKTVTTVTNNAAWGGITGDINLQTDLMALFEAINQTIIGLNIVYANINHVHTIEQVNDLSLILNAIDQSLTTLNNNINTVANDLTTTNNNITTLENSTNLSLGLKKDKALQRNDKIIYEQSYIYYTPSSPFNHKIEDSEISAKIGNVQKMYHQSLTAPTVPGSWVLLAGEYVTGELNIIYAEWIENGRVEYWITQEV
jgi:hypothetical protein